MRSAPLVRNVRLDACVADRPEARAITGRDLHSYLRRIGLEAAIADGPADVGLLRTVVAAQIASVPFENLDIHRGIPVDIEPAALVDKLVGRRRGGICYEVNGLLTLALRGLGFDAHLVGAEVLTDAGYGPPLGHVVLVVRIDGHPWLVDAGFGGEALVEEATDGDPGAGTAYDVRFESGSAYRTDGVLRPLADFVAMAHWHSTSPGSRFTRGIVCSVTRSDGRYTLSCAPGGDYRLTITGENGREARELDDADVVEVLRREFGVALADPPRPRDVGAAARL